MEQKQEVKEDLVEISNITRQIIFNKLAHYSTGELGDDFYFFSQAIGFMRSEVGEKPLQEKYKERYEDVKRALRFINLTLYKIKLLYDSLSDKKFDETQKERNISRIYKKELVKISPFPDLLFDVFILYLEKTNLKYQAIPNDYFKETKRKYTTFKFARKKEQGIETEEENQDAEQEDTS